MDLPRHRPPHRHDPPLAQKLDDDTQIDEDVDPDLAEKMRRYPEDFLPVKPVRGTFGFHWAQGVVSPFISSKKDKMDAIFTAIGHLLMDTAVVMDVGCGDGAFLHEAASRFACRCYGLEIDATLTALAREKAEERKVGHLIQVFEADLFHVFVKDEGAECTGMEKGEGRSRREGPSSEIAAALQDSTVFYFYLLPAVLDKLAHWLLRHLERAARGHLIYIFNTWAPALPELDRYLAEPSCDRAAHAKRGFFLYRS